jgi:hypothetical protein
VAGAYDAYSNLAAIRDQNLLEHKKVIPKRQPGPWPSIKPDIVIDGYR